MEQLKRLQFIEREMISEGKSPSEIDAAKASLREQSYSGIPPELSGVASLSETALNMNRGPRGLAAYMADGGETSVVRLGGRKTKNTPRPVNAPVGRQSMTLTDEDIGTLVDFSPFFGDIKGGVEGVEFIKEELKRNDPNYLLMGIVGGAAVVGVVPILGDVAQKLIMRGARNFKKDRVTEETLNMLSEQDAALVRNLTRKTPATKPSPGQNLADNIASDLRSGKINKVTDARLEGLDFQGEIRLRQHYIDGNVGTDADGVTITLANREQRMIDQGYNRVGVHGATPTLSNSFSQDGSVNDIRVFQPSSGGKSGEGVYLDIEAEGYAQDSLFSKSLGLSPYPTANKHAGFWNDGAHTPVREGATMYPLVARTDLATPKTLRNLRTQTVPLTPVQKIKKKFGLLNYTDVLDAQGKNAIDTLKKQGYTGVNSPDYGEITSFDGSGLRVPTAIFDPRLTNLKNIGMADGGAVMNGIGSLSETARNMSRGPRGLAAYQQFAEGGATIKGELNVDLQPLDLPVDGRMSYTQTDDGGSFDSEIRKTFEGGLGSLTPSFDYSTQNSSRNMGDVVIDENGEQIGFAVEGELFLNSDPNSEDKVRGAFEVEKSRNNTNFTFPEGEFVRTDEGLFKRFNLGMDLGKFGLDLNRMEGSGRDPVNSGSATIRIGENGIVRYSDSDRGEPTIGFNYAKEFADGGPVTSMRPRSRPTNDETEAEQLAASSEAFGDNELLADLMPILQNDPLAMLGYDPKIMRFDQPIGSSRAFYDPRSDTIHYGADYGSSFEVIVHELRHRGTQILRNQALKNPENFKERYGTAAYNFTSGLKGRTEANINQNSEQITNFGDKGTDEWINELLDNPDNFVYNAPFINEDGSTGSERVNDSYVVEYADKDALRSFRKTGEYPEAGRGPEGRYGSIGVPRRGLVRDRRGFGNTTTEYLNMTPYEKSKLITREYNLPRFTDQINPSEITKGISGMKQAATDLLQGQKEDGIFYADGGPVYANAANR